jgi:hypothetical protein
MITINGTTGIAGTNGSAGTPAVQGEDTNTGIFFPAADTVAVATGGSERMRVDSSGNLGLGVTPSAWSASFRALQMGSRSAVYQDSSAATAVANNIYNDGTNKYIASASATVALQEEGAHKWFTAPSGTAGNAITFTERARIDSTGLLVGTTDFSNITGGATAGIALQGAGTVWGSRADASGVFNRLSSNGTAVEFRRQGTTVGSVSVTTTATAYNTSSDYRLKENVAPMQNALDTVAQLNPVTYTWKADGSAGQGFIAHELQAVVPDCVTGEKDAVDETGNPQYQGVDTSFLVATLVAAIKELKAEVDSLKAQLEAK